MGRRAEADPPSSRDRPDPSLPPFITSTCRPMLRLAACWYDTCQAGLPRACGDRVLSHAVPATAIARYAGSEYIPLRRSDNDKLAEFLEIIAQTAANIITAIVRAPDGDAVLAKSTVPQSNDRTLVNCQLGKLAVFRWYPRFCSVLRTRFVVYTSSVELSSTRFRVDFSSFPPIFQALRV